MEIFRLTKKDHANLEGIGGLLFSGRWHEKGARVVYAASSRSLAILEYMVHITDPSILPNSLVLMTIFVTDNVFVSKIEENFLPVNWRENQIVTRRLGTKFIKENNHLLLCVPSAIVPMEYNFIINPSHKDLQLCSIKSIDKFSFDHRLVP
jgi:RES domain-containing protein